MTDSEQRASLRALMLATLAFFTCFYVWALFGPLSPAIPPDLGLSEVELGWLVAIPVVLGSLMRIPDGRPHRSLRRLCEVVGCSRSGRAMATCPTCQQAATTRDGFDRRGRQRFACRPCIRGHNQPSEEVTLAV